MGLLGLHLFSNRSSHLIASSHSHSMSSPKSSSSAPHIAKSPRTETTESTSDDVSSDLGDLSESVS